jgi:hypothetical protein
MLSRKRLREWVYPFAGKALRSPMTATAIAGLGFLAAAMVGVWPDRIRDGTAHAVVGPRGNPDAIATAFWCLTLLWAVLIRIRLASDDRVADSRFHDLATAVYHAPDYTVVRQYPNTFRELKRNRDKVRSELETQLAKPFDQFTRDEKLATFAAQIQTLLRAATGLALRFTGAGPAVRYGANVMLVLKPAAAPADAFRPDIVASLRFFDPKTGNLHGLGGLLYLPPELLFVGLDAREARVPAIALPFPKTYEDSQGHKLALPGAPWAVLTGEASIYEAAGDMYKYCEDMSATVRDEVKTYFSRTGDGKDIKSLVSFRIGDSDSPIGVLNIDCGQTYLLGREPEVYATFFALITPILDLLADPAIAYGGLL